MYSHISNAERKMFGACAQRVKISLNLNGNM